MAKKAVRLEHVHVGIVTVVDASFTGGGEKYLLVKDSAGKIRQLLLEGSYWLSANTGQVWRDFEKHHEATLLRRRAAEHRRDRDLTKHLPQDKRIKMLEIDTAEISNLEATNEPHAEQEYYLAE
jgi:hypothetical protein